MMKKSLRAKLSGIIAITAVTVLVFGFAACGGGGGSDPKTLVITDISEIQSSMADTSCVIGIFPPGTTQLQAAAWVGIVAGAGYDDMIATGSSEPYQVTVPLYSAPFDFYNPKRWTGSGTYDIFALLNTSGDAYVVRNVDIESATTTIDARTALKIVW